MNRYYVNDETDGIGIVVVPLSKVKLITIIYNAIKDVSAILATRNNSTDDSDLQRKFCSTAKTNLNFYKRSLYVSSILCFKLFAFIKYTWAFRSVQSFILSSEPWSML